MRSPLPFPCVPDRPYKILLAQVGTLSFSHPLFGVFKHGPDVDVNDHGDSPPLISATFDGEAEIVQLLIDAGATPTLRIRMATSAPPFSWPARWVTTT